MKLKIQAISDRGMVRENNEDAILIGEVIFRDDRKNFEFDLSLNSILMIAIADGMGGHYAGEVASEFVLQKFSEKVKKMDINFSEKELYRFISESVNEIHFSLIDEGRKDLQKQGMGTTFVGILFFLNKVYYINIGDSRLYRFRDGNLMQITRDHSLREMTGDDSISSHILLNAFGGDKDSIFFDFDKLGGKIFKDDIFLLCSDGLTDMLSDEEIEDILLEEEPVETLIQRAKFKGGRDNISVALVFISEIE